MNPTEGDRRAHLYRSGLLDWLACASAGRAEPAAQLALAPNGGTSGRVLAAAVAGHILDYDDTYLPGLAHLSAPTAPVALLLGAGRGSSIGEVLGAYAAGFESMAAVAGASHPHLYERGWHPTAVCGVVGAATAAARVGGLGAIAEAAAVRLALLGAGGLRAAFGSHGKSLQVGMAAERGVLAARLVEAGATVPKGIVGGPAGFEEAYGGVWATPDGESPAVCDNWIKAYPCCLQTHSAIEAAVAARHEGAAPDAGATVTVHPTSRRAAPLGAATSGLEAKFSIPYLVAFSLYRGAPGLDDFDGIDSEAAAAARRIAVQTDDEVAESAAILEIEGRSWAVQVARGSPQRPLTDDELKTKVRALAGTRLDGALDDPTVPARSVVEAAGL
jgi:2-methylcitrate dehydratase PrpD